MGGKRKQTRPERSEQEPTGKQQEFDIRLVPEYSGDGKVSEWLDKVALICQLRGVEDLTAVIPLRLCGDAFAVYQQLSEAEKRDEGKIRTALLTAFADDAFAAYSKFVGRKLGVNESVDVFMADLRRLSALFGGMSDQGLACAFVAGLPETAPQVLRAGCRVESLQLSQLLARARAVLADADDVGAAAAVTRGPPAHCGDSKKGS